MNDVLPPSPDRPAPPKKRRLVGPLIYEVLLLYILVIGALFRFIGIDWGAFQYLLPGVGWDGYPAGQHPT